MPFPFLPLDGPADTKLFGVVARRAHDAPLEDDEQLPRRRLVPADTSVERHEGHLERVAAHKA